ncbi:MAG: hypothetical protein IKY31_00185 [Bacteroidaceae bacterium]|nr:hypothetical protein [Bacteroidaceae bacterium]
MWRKQKTDLDENQLKGNVAFVKYSTYEADSKFGEIVKGDLDFWGVSTIEFNEAGYITSTSVFDEDGELYSKENYSYKNGKLDNIIRYNSEGKLDSKTVYKWKDDKQLSSFITYDKDGKEIQKFIREYEGENLKSSSYYYRDELKTKDIITKIDGMYILESVTYDKDGKEKGKLINEFISKKLIKSEYISDKESSYSVRYNEDGCAVKSENCYVEKPGILNTNEKGIYYYEYEFDNKNNWIKCVVLKGEDKQPFKVIEREITYS